MSRNFRPLAEAMNKAQWAKQADVVSGPVSAALLERLEDSAHLSQIRYLEARRERLETAIRECAEFPSLFWGHKYFRLCSASTIASTDEAVTELRRLLGLEIRRRGHWSHKPEVVVNLREALVFARFYRRFSRAIWARKSEAA